MSKQKIQSLETKIRQIKQALSQIRDMRPGSLSRQYKDPQRKKGAYYQLSYTYQMKSKTEYVRPGDLPVVRQQVAQYKRFRTLVDRWIHVALELSRKKLRPML